MSEKNLADSAPNISHPPSHLPSAQPDPSIEGGFVGAHWPGSLMERMGMEVLEHSASSTVITMPVEGNRQSAGILHGGANAALIESVASFSAQIHAREIFGPQAGFAVGIEISVSHLRSVESGMVTARSRAIHLGNSQTVHIVDITDSEGHVIASGRVTNRILKRRGK